ncbi:MAG TPA: ABC transporter ATP-binding protein/permease [Burkholderiales bacterium]|nr:ABC transporter ATP-binding protein/permease [Burkholderiales bacterium]
MNKQTSAPDAAVGQDRRGGGHLLEQVDMMSRAFWASPLRNSLLLLGVAIVAVIIATAYLQIRLNRWNQPFYDALARHDLGEFFVQLGVFAVIACALLALNVAQRWVTEMLKLKLREGLTRDLIELWMLPRRAFQLSSAGPIGVNPDQRMHEDARRLTELTADLGVGLLQSSILLATFVSVLWALSADFSVLVGGRVIQIPGYMVWAGILYAISASLLSYWVGHDLVGRNAERYAREADLRYSLVRVNEHIDAISLAGGEADEARRLNRDLTAVIAAMRRLVSALTNLTWVTAGYGWLTVVAPILVAAPLYFGGRISFGGLMMAAAAFTQVQSSLRWFIDNFSAIADWRATLLRVASFRGAMVAIEAIHDRSGRITIEEGVPGRMSIDDLEIASPAGCTMLAERSVDIGAGERIIILGEPGVGKTLLFRALAGLWPWGAGRIARPRDEAVLYMPLKPYLPPGTLKEVLAYPHNPDRFDPAAYADALERFGLGRLVPNLDFSGRWDRRLGEDEQQALMLARLLMHAPRWVVIDEVIDAVDAGMRARAIDMLSKDLKASTVIHISSKGVIDPMFTRVLHLIKDPATRRLVRQRIFEDGNLTPATA